MAKGKIKRAKYTSQGIHSSVAKNITNEVRREYMASSARIMNQLAAHQKGKRVVVTMENPNKNETNKKFIRVLAKAIWKDPRQVIISQY